MKARQLMAIVLLSGLLLSCQLTKKTSSFVVSFQTCEFEKRSTPVYDIATMNGHSSTNAEMYKLEDVDLYFNPEFEEAPYITLGDYAKLLSSYFRPQCKYEVLKEGNEEMLALYEEHGEPVYQIIVNYAKASFTYAGDPSPIIKPTSEDEGLDISTLSNREKLQAAPLLQYLPKLRCFVCNDQEWGMLDPGPWDEMDPGQIAAALPRRMEALGLKALVVTLGSRGAVWAEGKESGFCPPEPVPRVDAAGAGDAFFSGVGLGLSLGKSLAEACRLGSRMAGKVIGTTQSVCPPMTREELGL